MSRWNPDDIASARSKCDVCEREYIEYMRSEHEIFLMAQQDPEHERDLRADFAAWAESPDAERLAGPACPAMQQS